MDNHLPQFSIRHQHRRKALPRLPNTSTQSFRQYIQQAITDGYGPNNISIVLERNDIHHRIPWNKCWMLRHPNGNLTNIEQHTLEIPNLTMEFLLFQHRPVYIIPLDAYPAHAIQDIQRYFPRTPLDPRLQKSIKHVGIKDFAIHISPHFTINVNASSMPIPDRITLTYEPQHNISHTIASIGQGETFTQYDQLNAVRHNRSQHAYIQIATELHQTDWPALWEDINTIYHYMYHPPIPTI